MTECYIHSKKSGKRCSLERGHKPKHIFEQLCICGINFCIARNKRIIRAVYRKVVV